MRYLDEVLVFHDYKNPRFYYISHVKGMAKKKSDRKKSHSTKKKSPRKKSHSKKKSPSKKSPRKKSHSKKKAPSKKKSHSHKMRRYSAAPCGKFDSYEGCEFALDNCQWTKRGCRRSPISYDRYKKGERTKVIFNDDNPTDPANPTDYVCSGGICRRPDGKSNTSYPASDGFPSYTDITNEVFNDM